MTSARVDGAAAAAVLDAAVEARAFPGAVAEAGTSDGPLWTHTTGRLTYEDAAAAATPATLYDLASLTKVIATTSIAMRCAQHDLLALDARVSGWMPEWRSGPYADVTIRDLLEHASGLPAWLPLFQTRKGRDDFREAIAQVFPDYAPRTTSVYSDLGFIVLGYILEDVGNEPMDALFEGFREQSALPSSLRYGAVPGRDVAPTEFDAWRGRLPAGEVHDENALALGDGVAPHAGLFGTAADVGAFARVVLKTFTATTPLGTPEWMRMFATKSSVPDSSRALGWDTMLPTSSCGACLSPDAIGHTGFTGTSLWIDRARDMYFVLLTNRVHPTRENNAIRAVRQDFHNALLR